MNLEDCRKEIDAIDAQILSLLNKRAEAAGKIGVLKAKAGLPIIDLDRESEVLRRVSQANNGILADDSVIKIFRRIIRESRQIQIESLSKFLKKGTGIYR